MVTIIKRLLHNTDYTFIELNVDDYCILKKTDKDNIWSNTITIEEVMNQLKNTKIFDLIISDVITVLEIDTKTQLSKLIHMSGHSHIKK